MSPFEFEISYCLEVDLCGELILINLSERNINIHRCAGIFCTILIKICEIIYIYNLKKLQLLFRWFKFILKPPYSITHGKLRLAIWDTSFLDFLGQIWTQGTLRHILGPILVIFAICQFLTIPGPFEYFSENGWSQKIKVFLMKERSLSPLSV